MKRYGISILLISLSLLTVLSSCSVYFYGFQPKNENVSPEVIDYVKKHFYYCGYMTRWNDGIIEVFDETNYQRMPEILNVWNEIIGGSTIFRLSDNPNSPIHIYNQDGVFFEGIEVCALTLDHNNINGWHHKAKVLINTNPDLLYNKFNVYLHEFGHVIGFEGHTNGDTDIMGYSASTCVIPEIMVDAVRYVYGAKSDYIVSPNTAKLLDQWANAAREMR